MVCVYKAGVGVFELGAKAKGNDCTHYNCAVYHTQQAPHPDWHSLSWKHTSQAIQPQLAIVCTPSLSALQHARGSSDESWELIARLQLDLWCSD